VPAEAVTADAVSRPIPRVLVRSILIVAALAALSIVHVRATGLFDIADVYLLEQDGLVLVLLCAGLFALSRLPLAAETRLCDRLSDPALGQIVLWSCIASVLVVATAGWSLVLQRYPLSLDEFWALFDTRIFARGLLAAPVPEAWRPLAAALQPVWRLEVVGDTVWGSTYLPVNAALRAAFGAVGAEDLASAAWAVLACLMTWRLARRFWPDRQDAAVVAVLLLATSSQLLFTAMTPYAMSAHLALNMAWLVLFLEDRPWTRVAAVAVGLLACGLHQLIFHPLFVAPFVLELWLARRWRAAAFYTVSYALIGGFWTLYWSLLLDVVHAHAAIAGEAGAGFWLVRVTQLLQDFDPLGAGTVAKNLLRFIAWQHPLALPLLLAALPGAALAKGPLRPLVWGAVLTLLVVFVLMPEQGLGFGYRYLHGFLGGLALVGAQGWIRLTDPTGDGRPLAVRTAFVAATAVAVLVLLPLHAWQSWTLARPYIRASAAIAGSRADVVLVEHTGMRHGLDLVRNDPFLANRPKVMSLYRVETETLRQLCRGGTVALFDRRDGYRLGVPALEQSPGPYAARIRALLADPSVCRPAPAFAAP
jgi:hypothetical protein